MEGSMTIKDIAKECDCAVGTVSRVLNDQDYVSDKMRANVMRVVNKHGFVINRNAKDLKAHKSKTIIIIIKGIENMLFYGILETLQRKIEKLPYDSSVVIIDEYDNEAQRAWNLFYEKKPLGFIFLGGNPERFEEDFKRIKVPCVLITTKPKKTGVANLSTVSTDEFQASLDVVRYLAKNGHKNIGLIGGDFESAETAKNRYEGFIKGINLSGLDFDFDSAYVIARYSMEGGAQAAEQLVKQFPSVTAIFCMSDVMAIGAIRRLCDLGYKVPDDISIVGFDGLSVADYYCPKITTIRQSTEELAIQGLKTFIDRIENNAVAMDKTLPFEFIEGESVKKIN